MDERFEGLNRQASLFPAACCGVSQQFNRIAFSTHEQAPGQPATGRFNWRYFSALVCLALVTALMLSTASLAAGFDSQPPAAPLKLIFIHHSCGENWLADDNGGLARALEQNHYFVSDTNYGWGPEAIGDRTDIEKLAGMVHRTPEPGFSCGFVQGKRGSIHPIKEPWPIPAEKTGLSCSNPAFPIPNWKEAPATAPGAATA